jgi:hypothetical protein
MRRWPNYELHPNAISPRHTGKDRAVTNAGDTWLADIPPTGQARLYRHDRRHNDNEEPQGSATRTAIDEASDEQTKDAQRMKNYYVEIVKTDLGEVVKRLGPFSERKADRVDDGANINLNHSEYFTRIVNE